MSDRPDIPEELAADWQRLLESPPSPAPFRHEMVAGLPEPARRWLTHAIAEGTPLRGTGELVMHGRIKLGAWRSFTARQVLAPPRGFIWAATARVFGVPVSGFDRYAGGVGEMHWRLLSLLDVMSGTGADVTRSSAGRLAAEGVLMPTAFQQADWSSGSTPDIAVATWDVDGPESVELTVARDGALERVLMQRWGKPGDEPYGRYPFGVTVQEERTFDGVTIPAVFRAGWYWGTDRQDEGEFFRAEITEARF